MMYQKVKNSVLPPPLYKCIVVLVAAATLALTACSLLQEDGGEKSIRINLPPILSAAGNSRSISDDRIPTLKTETKRYRVTVNGMTREGTGSSYEFTLPVGINATVTVECLNSNGEVIIRAVKDFTVSGGDNIIDINLKADGNEIIPSASQPVPNQVTYSYGEADRHGNKNGIPSDPTTYSEGDLFEVKDGSGMTWDHAAQQSGFAGWSASPAIEPENGGQATNAPISGQKYKMPKGGVTLTAQWNKRQYSITYQKNEANSGGTPTQSVPGTSSVEALASANISSDTPPQVSTGSLTYSFTGWNTQAGGSGTAYRSGQQITMMTEDITLYAQWTSANVYTVTYNIGSGPTAADSGWVANDTYTEGISSAITLPTLTATGYTFNGWQINGATQQGGTTYTPTQSVTATAQWTINSYQVTYALDGGSGGPANGNVQYNASVALDAPTKTGYEFAGWSYGSTTYGGTSGNNSLTMPAQAITLTAQWTISSYQVTYLLDGGSGGPASGNVQYNTNVSLGAPTKTGYTFTGWSDGSTTYGGTSGNDSLTMPAQAITLTAQWTPIAYTITYDANGGGNNPNSTTFTVADSSVTFASSNTLAKTGYTCMGWETTGGIDISNMTNPADLINLMGGGTTLALRAKWEGELKSTPAVGDIIMNDGTLKKYTDTITASNAIAVVYKVEDGKAWAVGGQLNYSLKWADSAADGYEKDYILITTVNGNNFTGYIDGSTGLGILHGAIGDSNSSAPDFGDKYPAWNFACNYGTNMSLDNFATGWYFPSVKEVYEIYTQKTAVDNALFVVGGSSPNAITFSTQKWWSSSIPDPATSSTGSLGTDVYPAYALDFSNGDVVPLNKGEDWNSATSDNYGVCAVRQFTY